MALEDVTISQPVETWFVDKDDGTVIHFFDGGGSFSSDGTRCPSPRIRFEQNINVGDCDGFDLGETESISCPPGGTFQQGDFKILGEDVIPPLPDDFSFESGSVSRFPDRLSLFLEEFTPSRVGEDPALIGTPKFDAGGETYITRYDFINTESLGTSDGTSGQTFTVSGSEIKLPTRGTPIVFVGGLDGNRFSVTDDLSTAGSVSVFEYNETTGTVTFGDGENGSIPADGEEIVLRITIRNGGGVWEFVEIVEPPKAGIGIGGVKSIRDKNFYVQTDHALADAGKMLEVTSIIDGASRSFFNSSLPGKILLDITHAHDLSLGGSMTASGGTIVLFGTSATAFTLQTRGSTTKVTFEVDTGTIYPSISASVPGSDGVAVAVAGTGGQVIPSNPKFDTDSIESGILTTPKNYKSIVLIQPFVRTQEIQTFRQGGSNIVDPMYSLSFQAGGTTSSAGAPGIITDRIVRLIEIGDPDPSSHPGSPNHTKQFAPNAGIPIVTRGTFDDPVVLGVFSDFSITSTVFNFPSQITIGIGGWVQRIIGDSSRHTDFITIKYDCRQNTRDATLAAHILGFSLPDFTCELIFTPGTITVLPDIP